MSIKDDFKPYIDGNKLLAPGPVSPGTQRASDNGPMFTSEYFIMLKKNGGIDVQDEMDYENVIGSCIDEEGLLNRAPGDSDQEGPDDYYGVANGCMEMGNTDIPRELLGSLFKYIGCLNNTNPGTWTTDSFLARQPQLVCALITASFPSMRNPLHWLVRILALPLYVISALVLLTSCIDTASDDTDSRRLAWHLGNCVSKVSLLNWLAYKVWLKRLCKVYPNGMKDVAALYYQPQGNNPYSKWWTT